IRKQLRLKCKENAIELVEVFGKDIGIECSRCGSIGNRKDGIFTCACGHSVPEKQNVAQNAKKRGLILVAEKAFPYGGNTVAGVRWTPRAGDRVSGG
ncbi:MAG: transposase, partial [Selenomonadaceae bacterium]|nr:transposase [Selenomonadaceae bacterium]